MDRRLHRARPPIGRLGANRSAGAVRPRPLRHVALGEATRARALAVAADSLITRRTSRTSAAFWTDSPAGFTAEQRRRKDQPPHPVGR